MTTVAVVGLGYVGLPLARAFAAHHRTIGYDIAPERVAVCVPGLICTDRPARLAEADFIAVAVPTPVTAAKVPDMGPLLAASETVGRYLRPGATVVYESTVYPGATEGVCIPALERASGLTWRRDFHVGYSPERINPGDADHTLANTVKVVAGDCHQTLERVATLYAAIAPVHRAPSIAVAEMAKALENAQRDVNIALMNEAAMLCHRAGIETGAVLAAAGTKWNFLPFRPGLVGGHCIGVDPYYLTHRAAELGGAMPVIEAARRTNDGMGRWIAAQTVKAMGCEGRTVNLMGMTYKPDVADFRSSQSFALADELRAFGLEVRCHDPFGEWPLPDAADALVIAVGHSAYRAMDLGALVREGGVVVDVPEWRFYNSPRLGAKRPMHLRHFVEVQAASTIESTGDLARLL